jgi:hypothetical protein
MPEKHQDRNGGALELGRHELKRGLKAAVWGQHAAEDEPRLLEALGSKEDPGEQDLAHHEQPDDGAEPGDTTQRGRPAGGTLEREEAGVLLPSTAFVARGCTLLADE